MSRGPYPDRVFGTDEDVATAYAEFAEHQARGYCPPYEDIAAHVAGDRATLAWLEGLPAAARQPNLLLAAVRYLGGPVEAWPSFRDWLTEHRPEVEQQMRTRRTQTNEAGRCATLLPWLPTDRPLALVEVGCSAGLCLYPDRYAYRYRRGGDDVLLGTGRPLLECDAGDGIALPEALPDVRLRAGTDLNPLDVTDADTRRWLAALVWPGQAARQERLAAAAELVAERSAAGDGVRVRQGDLLAELPRLLDEIPHGLTPVIMHSAVLAYVPRPEDRRRFADLATAAVAERGAVWIGNEAPGVLPVPDLDVAAARRASRGRFLMCVNGIPVAWSGSHGQSLDPLDG